MSPTHLAMGYGLSGQEVRTALANRGLYEKELKDIAPDLLSLEKELPAINAPTLILWGDRDQVLDVSSVPVFETGLKNHQTVIIKDCGHLPMLEKPKETAEKYLSFLKGLAKKN